MKRKTFIKILSGIVAFILLIILLTIIFVEPMIAKKIRAALNETSSKYLVEIDKIDVSLFTLGLELKEITIHTRTEYKNEGDLNGEIAFIKCKKINLLDILFKKGITIGDVTLSHGNINGMTPFSKAPTQPIVSFLNIQIGKILLDKINISIKNNLSAEAYTVNDAVLKVYNLQVLKNDTLSVSIIRQFDLEAKEFLAVSGDSMNTIILKDINYSTTSNLFVVNNFAIHPNYKGYDFTSRHKFQKDCIEAEFHSINVHHFSAAAYLKSGSLVSSFVEIGKMDVNVFRDNRKEFLHKNKTTFQDLIYNYPSDVNIDSIGVITGHVTYTEHAEQANHPGRISFNEIHAKIYRISNDTIFKKEKGYLELKSTTLLMGKGKLSVLLKSRLFDSRNTFSLEGALEGMDARELNPILERNAFLYVSSGRIDEMKFDFTANNNKSIGRMTLRYHGLDVAVKNKQTDDTTAIKERIVSFFANKKIADSNPTPGKEVRVGIIDFERDPETFLFSYCFQSILSGIKSSIAKTPAWKKGALKFN